MTKKTRKILFYSSIALFLILSSIIVLFALGYGYDFSKNQLLKTGGFGITANTGVTVYIDDQLAGSTSFLSDSFSKSRLLPGSYTVRVEADGYESWIKQVEIQEGTFTDFPSILLPPSDLDTQLLETHNLPTNLNTLYFYKKVFYFISNNQLLSYNTETHEQEVLLKKIETFFADGNTLVYRGSDKAFYIYSLDNKKIETLSAPITDLKNIQQFSIINDSTYLITKTGTQPALYQMKDEQLSKLNNNTTGFKISPDGAKLLYYNSHEIYVLYLRDTNYQPYRLAGETKLLTRTSRSISDAQWHKDSEHILFDGSGVLTLIELDDRSEANSYDIANQVSSFFYYSNDDTIYKYAGSKLTKIYLSN